MDEGIIAQEPIKKDKKPIILAAIIAAVVIVVAIAIVSRLGKASFNAAEYMPSDVALAVTVDLTSSEGKNAAKTYIEGILKDAGIKDYQKDIFDSINKEYKIDVQKDVLPHINGLGGFAILPQMSGFSPDMIFVAGTRSPEDAEELVKLFTSKQTKPIKNSYKKIEYYNLSTNPQPGYIGAINNAVVISSTSSAFTSVVDTINKKTNLAGNADFKKTCESCSDSFAVTYFSGSNFYKMMGPMLAIGAAQAPPGSADSVKQRLESIVMILGNAVADSKGIHYKSTAMMKEEQPTAPVYDIKELVKGVPVDAAFLVSANGYDKIWKDAKPKMMKDPAAKAQYDELAKNIKTMFNIDLDKDLMDNLKGLSFYMIPKGDIKAKSIPGSLVLVLDVKDPAAMNNTLQKVHSAIATMGYTQFKPLAISGSVSKASIAALKDGSMQIADTISDTKLVFVMSGTDAKGCLNSSVSALSSKNGIADTASFKKFSEMNSDKCSSIVYGDVSKFMHAYSAYMPSSDKEKADAIMKKISVFGITSINSGKQTESSLEIPFLK